MRWLALLLLAAPVSAAGETWILGPGLSYHFERNGENERHFGIGWEKRLTPDLSASLTALDNSHHQLSLYAVGAWTPLHTGRWRLGGALGLATGYKGRGEPDRQPERALQPLPFPGALAAYERRRWGVNVVLIPGRLVFVHAKVPW